MIDVGAYYTLILVTLSTCLLGIVSGIIGVFIFWRRESLLGDMISHAALPGIALMFLATHNSNPTMLLFGGILSGVLSVGVFYGIKQITQLSTDAALGIVLSSFFGLGLMTMTYIQKTGIPHQSLLNKFLFGNAASLLYSDFLLIGTITFSILCCIMLMYRIIKTITFDRLYATTLGYRMHIFDGLILCITIITTALGLQTVGVVLMSALLITPAATAYQYAQSFESMIMFSAIIAGTSSILGSLLSSIYPHLPTGPLIVVILSIHLGLAFIMSPKRYFL